MTIVLSLSLLLCVLALFLPLLNRNAVPEFYISSTPDQDRVRKQQNVNTMLADLRQEFDSGKISETEFASMAAEFLAELDRLQKPVPSASARKSNKREYCKECGAVRQTGIASCSQCGAEFQ